MADDKIPDDDYNPFKPVDKNHIEKGNVEDEIDRKLMDLRENDKIKLMNEVQKSPPEPKDMEVELPDDVYRIDLRTLLNAQLSDCPSTVIPMLIDHAVRTAVDIKDTYRPERRLPQFEYMWVIFLIIGLGAGFIILNWMFGIF